MLFFAVTAWAAGPKSYKSLLRSCRNRMKDISHHLLGTPRQPLDSVAETIFEELPVSASPMAVYSQARRDNRGSPGMIIIGVLQISKETDRRLLFWNNSGDKAIGHQNVIDRIKEIDPAARSERATYFVINKALLFETEKGAARIGVMDMSILPTPAYIQELQLHDSDLPPLFTAMQESGFVFRPSTVIETGWKPKENRKTTYEALFTPVPKH
jgi:hypothetical protein